MTSPDDPRPWFVRAVPIAWAVVAFLSLQNPGDEYMLFALASLPGVWVALLANAGDIHSVAPVVFAVGAAVCAGLGWLLDRVQASVGLWMGVVVVSTVALTALALGRFETYEAAMSKNGSLAAYVFAAASLGILLASLLGLIQGLVRPLRSAVRAPV